jgi:hypothetical protein
LPRCGIINPDSSIPTEFREKSVGLICLIFKHKRARDKVWNDGLDFRSQCKRCQAPLIKQYGVGWRIFDPRRDANPDRLQRGEMRWPGTEPVEQPIECV